MLFFFFFLCPCLGWVAYSAPLPRRIVDLTHVINGESHKYPIFRNFTLTVVRNGTKPEGHWYLSDEYTSSTHLGTHMDSPSHFVKGGSNIDQIPISHFIAPAAVIDITNRSLLDPDAGVNIEDLQTWESLTRQRLDGMVLLMRTGWDRYYSNSTAYLGTSGNDITQLHFPGLEPEAAQWLLENRKIIGIGTDALSFDKGNSQDLMSHQILLGSGIYGLENVANLDKIPIYGATVHVMPMKMARASGAPIRIVATFPDVIFA